jgi:hypothetical protein
MFQRYHTHPSGDHAEVADLAAFMTRTIGPLPHKNQFHSTHVLHSESIWMPDASVLQINRASALLKGLSGRGRLLLLCQFGEGEKTVKELAELSGMLQASTSQHLAFATQRNCEDDWRADVRVLLPLCRGSQHYRSG